MGLSFAEWEAQRKSGQPAPSVSPEATNADPSSTADTPFRPNLNASWLSDSARYAGSELKGAAHSPIDALKGLLGLPGAVVSGAGELIKDPSLLLEAPQMVADIAQRPEELGSMLGQAVVGKAVPGVARFAADRAPGIVGNTISAAGRGAEAVGGSKPVKALAKFGPLEAMVRGDWKGLAATVAPQVLEYGGQKFQSLGNTISNIDIPASLQGLLRRIMPGEQITAPTAADSMRATVDAAKDMHANGASRPQANARAGYGVKSTEVPYDRTAMIDQPDLTDFQGPKAIAQQLADLSQTRKALGSNPVDLRAEMFDRGLRKASSGKMGHSPTPDLQDALNEIARKRYVAK